MFRALLPLLLPMAHEGRKKGMKAGRLSSGSCWARLVATGASSFLSDERDRSASEDLLTSTLGQAEPEPTSLAHNSVQPWLLKIAVSRYCIFSQQNNPQLCRKPAWGAGKGVCCLWHSGVLSCPHREVEHRSEGDPSQAAAPEDSEKASCLSFLQHPCASLTLLNIN